MTGPKVVPAKVRQSFLKFHYFVHNHRNKLTKKEFLHGITHLKKLLLLKNIFSGDAFVSSAPPPLGHWTSAIFYVKLIESLR